MNKRYNLNWAIKIPIFFLIFCFSSCSVRQSKREEVKVLGGYEASSYMDEKDSQDSLTISGIITEAKTKRKVPDAEIRFLDFDGNTLMYS